MNRIVVRMVAQRAWQRAARRPGGGVVVLGVTPYVYPGYVRG